jgi:hypothetical protein
MSRIDWDAELAKIFVRPEAKAHPSLKSTSSETSLVFAEILIDLLYNHIVVTEMCLELGHERPSYDAIVEVIEKYKKQGVRSE